MNGQCEGEEIEEDSDIVQRAKDLQVQAVYGQLRKGRCPGAADEGHQ